MHWASLVHTTTKCRLTRDDPRCEHAVWKNRPLNSCESELFDANKLQIAHCSASREKAHMRRSNRAQIQNSFAACGIQHYEMVPSKKQLPFACDLLLEATMRSGYSDRCH